MEEVKEKPAVAQDAELILKLNDKLESLKMQVYNWKAKAKVFEQKGHYNFDTFMKAPSTPNKRASKGLKKGQDWSSLNLAQQYEILHQVANEHTRVTLNFEAINMALKTSLASSALKKSLNSGEKGDKDSEDAEEKNYLLELLEEQAERSENIIKTEDQRLEKELKLLSSKCELAAEFSSLQEQYSLLLDGNPDLAPAKKRGKMSIENSEVFDNLKAEEDRVVQMKTMIQKLMFSNPHGCLNFDEDVKKKHEEMLVKCGQDLPTLRNDED